MAKRGKKSLTTNRPLPKGYDAILGGISELLEAARRASARSVNSIMTVTYWEIGRRIVEFEQAGEKRAEYGTELLKRLSGDLSAQFGRGFSERNLRTMRSFYTDWPIRRTLSAESPTRVLPAVSDERAIAAELDETRKRLEMRLEVKPREGRKE